MPARLLQAAAKDRITMPAKWRRLIEVCAAGCGLCLFALFVHQGMPLTLLSGAGMIAAAIAVYFVFRDEASPAAMLGLSPFSRKAAAYVVFGCALGMSLAIVYRLHMGWAIMPAGLSRFAAVAVLIGATEELIYRGFMQGRLLPFGPVPAVVLAALLHTGYKCCLFAAAPFTLETSFTTLAAATFLGGLAFGATRAFSASLIPAIAAHGCFDIIVYGELAQTPPWIWT